MSVLLCTCVNSFPYFSTPTCSAQFCPEMLPSTSLSCTLHTYIKRRRNRILHFLKVSKFQEHIFLFSFAPKNKWFFLDSALASKMSQIKKWRHFIILMFKNSIIEPLIFLFDHFRSLGQKSKNNFVWFWFKWEQDNLLLKFADL